MTGSIKMALAVAVLSLAAGEGGAARASGAGEFTKHARGSTDIRTGRGVCRGAAPSGAAFASPPLAGVVRPRGVHGDRAGRAALPGRLSAGRTEGLSTMAMIDFNEKAKWARSKLSGFNTFRLPGMGRGDKVATKEGAATEWPLRGSPMPPQFAQFRPTMPNVFDVSHQLLEAGADTLEALDRAKDSIGKAGTDYFSKELGKILSRLEKELLGLKRQSGKETKSPPVVMLQGANGEQHLLKYGDAIPEIIYGAQEGAGFGANLQCSLQEDEKGNICMGKPGVHKGTVLPLASDVMFLRQMASFSAISQKKVEEKPAPVTVAVVTIPVNDRGDILVTQRASKGGLYNGLWVFPGGHVDCEETLKHAAVREVEEETGIVVTDKSLHPVAVWEGSVTSRRRQFCVVFYAAEATCGNSLECTMELQTKEVHRAVWVPREFVNRILDTHVNHEDLLDGMLKESEDGPQNHVQVPLSDIQRGLGDGHKFALQTFLKSNPGYEKKGWVRKSA